MTKRLFFSPVKDVLDDLSLEGAVLDFEAAMWGVFRYAFPEILFKECVFHLIQSVVRKLREIGLQSAYNNYEGTRAYCRRLFALPFLTAEKIPSQFRVLKEKASDNLLQLICDCIEDTLQHVEASLMVCVSSGQAQQAPNTDKDWHHRLNWNAGGGRGQL